jgi:hypothetical protein
MWRVYLKRNFSELEINASAFYSIFMVLGLEVPEIKSKP